VQHELGEAGAVRVYEVELPAAMELGAIALDGAFPNTIHFPSGDQLPSSSQKPKGVIRCKPVPSTLTT
jgi:hypothetical protein